MRTDYKTYFKDRRFMFSCIIGFIFLAVAFVINYYASVYATDSVSNYGQ